MLGTGLRLTRGGRGENRFNSSAKARRAHRNQKTDHPPRAQSDVTASQSPSSLKEKPAVLLDREPENLRAAALEQSPKPLGALVVSPLSSLQRFLESITPSVPAQYLSKTTMRGWRTCDVEFQPYFVLGDLWESFKEWSAYGAGVPLVLNDSDCVMQYYVPYLSGIQIYGKSMKLSAKPSRRSEDSDSDFRDSSSDCSTDCEPERASKFSGELCNHHHLTKESPLGMDGLSLKDELVTHQEDVSSDEGESLKSQGYLLYEYLEQEPPYCREPLADKISDLLFLFPELKALRSCDLTASSWISVAWYPIYRIPTGPTLKDLDACFLTYHYLHTSLGGAQAGQSPVMAYPSEIDGVPKMSLPVFGLASYKFKGPLWTPPGGCEHQLANYLLQVADNWLRLRKVSHPDFLFFCRR